MEEVAFDRWAAARRLPPGLELERPGNVSPYLRQHLWRPVRRRLFEAGMWLIGEHRAGIEQALDVQLAEVLLPVPSLDPRLDGLSILQISDLHLGTLPGLGEAVAAAVAGLSVDVCVLTGDYAPVYRARPDRVTADLRPILAGIQARQGIYGVLGNYDSAPLARTLRASGLCRLLINETVTLSVAGAEVSITGTDDPYGQLPGPILAALAAPAAGFRIALVHSPDMAAAAAAAGYSLYLCGHTHGGQICWPGGSPILTNCRRRDLASGLWREAGMWGYTSRGAGVSGIPRRHSCPPEVTLFRLLAGAPIDA